MTTSLFPSRADGVDDEDAVGRDGYRGEGIGSRPVGGAVRPRAKVQVSARVRLSFEEVIQKRGEGVTHVWSPVS